VLEPGRIDDWPATQTDFEASGATGRGPDEMPIFCWWAKNFRAAGGRWNRALGYRVALRRSQ